MCAVFKNKAGIFKPGRLVHGATEAGPVAAVWAGFARSEILEWWLERGCAVDLEAAEFAERSRATRRLVWGSVGEGMAIAAVLDRTPSTPVIRVVTRPAGEAEIAVFDHPRMPLLVARRFPVVAWPAAEPDLFGE
jgi:hypothetical protein